MASVVEQMERPFRFFHIREKYLLFTATCGEKRAMRHCQEGFPTAPFLVVGKKIGLEDVRPTFEKLDEVTGLLFELAISSDFRGLSQKLVGDYPCGRCREILQTSWTAGGATRSK